MMAIYLPRDPRDQLLQEMGKKIGQSYTDDTVKRDFKRGLDEGKSLESVFATVSSRNPELAEKLMVSEKKKRMNTKLEPLYREMEKKAGVKEGTINSADIYAIYKDRDDANEKSAQQKRDEARAVETHAAKMRDAEMQADAFSRELTGTETLPMSQPYRSVDAAGHSNENLQAGATYERQLTPTEIDRAANVQGHKSTRQINAAIDAAAAKKTGTPKFRSGNATHLSREQVAALPDSWKGPYSVLDLQYNPDGTVQVLGYNQEKSTALQGFVEKFKNSTDRAMAKEVHEYIKLDRLAMLGQAGVNMATNAVEVASSLKDGLGLTPTMAANAAFTMTSAFSENYSNTWKAHAAAAHPQPLQWERIEKDYVKTEVEKLFMTLKQINPDLDDKKVAKLAETIYDRMFPYIQKPNPWLQEQGPLESLWEQGKHWGGFGGHAGEGAGVNIGDAPIDIPYKP